MLIPHLHFCGDCAAAMALYEQALGANVRTVIPAPGGAGISHAVMDIRGQTVFLNDRFGNKARSTDCAMHMIVMFESVSALLACYGRMKDGSVTIDPLEELPYSKLAVQFLDRFGVQWGFLVEESA